MKTVKRIVFITCAVLCGITGYAQWQQKTLQSKNLDAFAGIWEYKTANETFRIVFKKGTANTVYAKYDCLIGGYSYSKNGTLIGDYTANIPNSYTSFISQNVTILASNAHSNPDQIDPNRLDVLFRDRKLNKTTTGFARDRNKFTLLSPSQARFQLFEDEGEQFDGPIDIPEGFSVPADVVMTKVSQGTNPPGTGNPGGPAGQPEVASTSSAKPGAEKENKK
ncbi:MAG: hypothetical protein LBL90_01260 [Prevotellaceae bacterium]|jgi:hypothetical protein|nr:hypothetical protein [Prevotellaceae bacterium]